MPKIIFDKSTDFPIEVQKTDGTTRKHSMGEILNACAHSLHIEFQEVDGTIKNTRNKISQALLHVIKIRASTDNLGTVRLNLGGIIDIQLPQLKKQAWSQKELDFALTTIMRFLKM